jgi:hypothetical protein
MHTTLTGLYGVSKATLGLRAADSTPEVFVAVHEVDTSNIAVVPACVLLAFLLYAADFAAVTAKFSLHKPVFVGW